MNFTLNLPINCKMLAGYEDEFHLSVSKVSAINDNFKLWSVFAHSRVMGYICLYLSGRKAD